jgi:hypothetical protein
MREWERLENCKLTPQALRSVPDRPYPTSCRCPLTPMRSALSRSSVATACSPLAAASASTIDSNPTSVPLCSATRWRVPRGITSTTGGSRPLSADRRGALYPAPAAEHDGRIVAVGQLVLFSTATGHAWLLDRSDLLAVRLARDGESELAHIEDTDSAFAIGWTGRRAAFVYSDRESGRVVILCLGITVWVPKKRHGAHRW